MQKELQKRILLEYLPMSLTFIGIVTCAIIFKQAFIKTLPVCFSLIIGLLTSRANRIAFLFGATNCLIYIVGYYMEGVYGSMISAGFSAVVQTATFFSWKKKAYKQATEFRVLRGKNRIILALALICAWGIASFILFNASGKEYILDGLILILGFALPVMQMFALIDALPLNIISVGLSLIMWLRIIVLDGVIANTTYLISVTYSLYMTIRMAKKWIALYKEQQSIKENTENSLPL